MIVMNKLDINVLFFIFILLFQKSAIRCDTISDILDNTISRSSKEHNCNVAHAPLKYQTSNITRELIGPYTFRLISEVFYATIGFYEMPWDEFEIYRERLVIDHIKCLQPGAIVFVNTEWMDSFINHIYDHIKVPFVLVSGGYTDHPNPAPEAISTFKRNDSKIIHWYAQNCQSSDLDPLRFSCIPIGLNDHNVFTRQSYAGLQAVTQNFPENLVISVSNTSINSTNYRPKVVHKNEAYDILMSRYDFRAHPIRTTLWELFCGVMREEDYIFTNKDGIKSYCLKRTDYNRMFNLTIESKFVISPPGFGVDCYRTYDTLALGSYPILLSSGMDTLHSDLPVLIVKDVSEITKDLLTKTYERFEALKLAGKLNYDKLRTSYWYARIRSHGHPSYSYSIMDREKSRYNVLNHLGLKDGDLIKGRERQTYVIRNGTKQAIPNAQVFFKYGWEFSNVKTISELGLAAIDEGPGFS